MLLSLTHQLTSDLGAYMTPGRIRALMEAERAEQIRRPALNFSCCEVRLDFAEDGDRKAISGLYFPTEV